MGLDPENGEYKVGLDNPSCHVGLFDGETPKYIEARIKDVTKCIGWPGEPPNGVFLLTQQPDAKTWRLSAGGYIYGWNLEAATSTFSVITLFLGQIRLWFWHQINNPCIDTFTNQNTCGPFTIFGQNGTAEIFWGSSIFP